MSIGWLENWLDNSEQSIKRMQLRIKGRRKGSDSTVQLYAYGVRDYLQFINLKEGPDSAIQSIRDGKVDPTLTIDDWIDDLLQRVSSGTARKYIGGVKRWLQVNKVTVEWSDIEMPIYESVEEDRSPTTEELRQILTYTYLLRDRAVVLCAASSGLRIRTLLSLTYGDCDFKSSDDVVVVIVNSAPGRKIRGKRAFVTFFSPEARETLLAYRKEREKRGEKITSESYLFPATTDKSKRISTATFRVQWLRILKRAGLDQKGEGGKWHELHFHVLRKWFETRCKIAGVKASFYQHWMTHKGGKDPETYLDASYFKPVFKEHATEYRKVIPYLALKTISETTLKMVQNSLKDRNDETEALKARIEELEKKNLELKKQLNGYVLSGSQVSELLRRIEKLEKQARKRNS